MIADIGGGGLNSPRSAAVGSEVKALIADFKSLGGKWPGNGDIMGEVGNAAFKQTPPIMLNYGKELVKKAVKGFLNSIGLQKGTESSVPGMTWVGEAGPELMNMPQGKKVFSNVKSGQKLGGSIEATVTAAFAAAMSGAAKPLEDATMTTLTRAIDRATRRVASRSEGAPREAVRMENTRTVVVNNAVFPNVKDGDDAKDFIENLVLVTSGDGTSSGKQG